MEAKYLMQPVFALALLTMVVTVVMYFTRVASMKKLRVHPQKAQDTAKLKDLLPPEVTRISNNYNHLFEQPTLFYAISLSLVVLDMITVFAVVCAWTYVGLRVVHSLIQTTKDVVMARFILTWMALAAMIAHGAYLVFL